MKYLWQFPQHLLALIIILFYKLNRRIIKTELNNNLIKNKIYYINNIDSSFSLGYYLFIENKYNDIIIKHEKGHSIQSLYTGIFYLLLVGIPSIFNNLWWRINKMNWKNPKNLQWYYSRWPEGGQNKWWHKYTADGLAGITR
jgi:hypothetical protein